MLLVVRCNPCAGLRNTLLYLAAALQEHGVVSEMQAYPGSHAASYPGSHAGSQPGSQPSSRPGSPSAHAVSNSTALHMLSLGIAYAGRGVTLGPVLPQNKR
jgi:hypothetical protein